MGVAAFTVNYLVDQGVDISHSRASLMFAFCQLTFTCGRFFGAALLRFVDTAFLLSTYGLACMVCCLGVALGTGRGGIASLYMLFFFESICYPVSSAGKKPSSRVTPFFFFFFFCQRVINSSFCVAVHFHTRNEGAGAPHETWIRSDRHGTYPLP